MADKTGRAALVSQIQELCLDYRALRHIAKTSREPEKWSVFLKDYRQDNRSDNERRFDEVTAALQSEAPESVLYRALIDAIDKATS